jgi:hypothetical protein
MQVNLRNFNTDLNMHEMNDVISLLVNKGNNLNLVIILCPLFERGVLEKSSLISGKNISIRNSRVNSKWEESIRWISLLSINCQEKDVKLHIDFVFADNGTPMNSFKKCDLGILKSHELVWRDEVKQVEKKYGINSDFYKFSEITPEVPRFVDINKSSFLEINPIVDGLNLRVDFINKVNQQLNVWFEESSDHPNVRVNRKNKKRVSRLLSVFDLDTAFVLCTTYLGKRFRLPDKFSSAVFVWLERMEVLLTVDDMLDEFKNVQKVMVKV